MLASFKGGTAFVLAGTDGHDDTETAGEGSTFVVGAGDSKAIIEDTGAADTVFEDWVVVMVVASSFQVLSTHLGCLMDDGAGWQVCFVLVARLNFGAKIRSKLN